MVRFTRNRKLELTVFRTRTVNLTTFRDVGRARRIGRVKRKHTTFATPTRSFLGQKILSRVRRQQQIIRGRARTHSSPTPPTLRRRWSINPLRNVRAARDACRVPSSVGSRSGRYVVRSDTTPANTRVPLKPGDKITYSNKKNVDDATRNVPYKTVSATNA